MRIIVCVKQVPGTNKVGIDEETGSLIRSGIQSKMNPYDLYAIETAFRIASDYLERHGIRPQICALTMGPPQAESVIREAYALGADEGYLLTDARFAGADVLATSRVLSAAIRRIAGEGHNGSQDDTAAGYDLIICGKQTTDGDTAQVGPAIAEFLNIPHVAWVSRITDADGTGITVEQDLTDITLTVRMDYKCLITVEKDIYQPRLPSYRTMLRTGERAVVRLGFDDLEGVSEADCGLKGSPTRVERIFAPEAVNTRTMLNGTPAELGEKIYSIIKAF